VEADGQRLGVLGPERLEEQLGLGAGVDEDERGAVGADQLHHRAGGVAAALAGPGRRGLGLEQVDVGLGAGLGLEHPRAPAEEARQRRGILDRGRQADAAHGRAEGLQAGEAERQLVAALGFRQRVNLVEDDAPEAAEDARRFGVA